MEDKKTIFDYAMQTMAQFGIMVVLLNVLGFLFGDMAREISTIFALGSAGLTRATMLQFLLVSVLVTCIRYIFFTDVRIKKLSVVGRTVGMVCSIILLIAVMCTVCGWFPVNMWEPWAMFFLCFGVCFVVSVGLTSLKEKMENRRMQEALEKLKQEEKNRMEN